MAKRAYNPTRFASMVISQSRLSGTKGSNGLPPVSKVTKDGDLEKFAIEETQGWTLEQFGEGQELLIVGHFEPTFGSGRGGPTQVRPCRRQPAGFWAPKKQKNTQKHS